jgi:LemA protein
MSLAGFVGLLAALLAALLLWAVLIYNRLVARREQAEEGWSGIDVQLKRRANLIPNLVETVKAYTSHEERTLETLIDLRGRAMGAATAPPGERAAVEERLTTTLGHLFAVVENYPQLRASESYLALQQSLSEIEDHIQMARRYYNGAVRNLNTLVESFPSNLVAGRFGFRQADYYEIDAAADRALPEVRFGDEPS